MIYPKVREIEEKFSRGEGLCQDDINTLLLKFQYNHIDHLDKKLDEIVVSVRRLEKKFEFLEQKIEITIQKALNKNMIILIVVIGAFLTLSKIIDKF
jgi:low affinity Fe/Cu permease